MPRKPEPQSRTKTAALPVRVKDAQKERYQRIADAMDENLSDWVRNRLDAFCDEYERAQRRK